MAMDGMDCTANKNTTMHLQIEKGASEKKVILLLVQMYAATTVMKTAREYKAEVDMQGSKQGKENLKPGYLGS